MTAKPTAKPKNPNFSSGPCAKRPGYDVAKLNTEVLGRSHRSKLGKSRLQLAINLQREVLGIPKDYHLGIVAGSDTGAVEMAMWSLLGARGVDVLAWESFGKDWVTDITKQLKLTDVRKFEADYGKLPDLSQVDFDRDVVFTWNGTTSGVKVPNGDWIKADRKGLTICDATSAVYAMEMPWDKLDVVTYSWQKVLGGEGAHGILILSPRAVARLESYTPAWPMPKIFRMTKKDKDGSTKLAADIFEGATINTPSMLANEDAIDALTWGKSVDLKARSAANLEVFEKWVGKTAWIDFLAENAEIRSNTSVCFKFSAPEVASLSAEGQQEFVKKFTSILEKEGVANDIGGYRDAPPGIRIWCGATVETSDLEALTPWLEWAYAESVASLAKAA
jgi:phosphoserine aminotransferase